ncbi:MAG: HNH endonuclease [Caldilineaceae bacterium]|nr:HNH endonuclease [Caldilineaceae bacterium]
MMNEFSSARNQRRFVAERANRCCEYCYSPRDFSPDPFSIEHIIPLVLGGTNHNENLAFSCQGCNNHKFTSRSAIDPVTGETVPLYHPRLDEWSDHFTWSRDYQFIIGLTAKGRATVDRLRLNRDSVVNLRRVLYLTGEHPAVKLDH